MNLWMNQHWSRHWKSITLQQLYNNRYGIRDQWLVQFALEEKYETVAQGKFIFDDDPIQKKKTSHTQSIIFLHNGTRILISGQSERLTWHYCWLKGMLIEADKQGKLRQTRHSLTGDKKIWVKLQNANWMTLMTKCTQPKSCIFLKTEKMTRKQNSAYVLYVTLENFFVHEDDFFYLHLVSWIYILLSHSHGYYE